MAQVDLQALEDETDWEFTEMLKRRQRMGYDFLGVKEYPGQMVVVYMVQQGAAPSSWIGKYYHATGTIDTMALSPQDLEILLPVVEG